MDGLKAQVMKPGDGGRSDTVDDGRAGSETAILISASVRLWDWYSFDLNCLSLVSNMYGVLVWRVSLGRP